jgi:hypothetical protein
MKVVSALHEVDPGFVALCKALFGDVAAPEDIWEFMYAPDGISKMSPDVSDVHVPVAGRLVRKMRRAKVEKADSHDVVWEGTFAKMDTEKRQVFGWASIVKMDGKPVVDRQGDWISPEEIEKAAYQYVEANRTGGHQHKRAEDGTPFKASDMIESFVITPEKIEKMGLPEDTPCGWWVGYKVHDDEAWEKVKKGEVTGFSIHGKGRRQTIGEAVSV